MGILLQLAAGVCLIILVSGLVHWGHPLGFGLIILVGGSVGWGYLYLTNRRKRGQREEDELRVRLEEVERRLTEVQEVMLALSEKFDQWQEDRLQV